MNTGLHLTGFRLAFFGQRIPPPGLRNTSNALCISAHADIQYVDEPDATSTGNGDTTGWGWIGNDRYYFKFRSDNRLAVH